MTLALALENLAVSYGATPALHGLSFAIAPGEAFGLVGESGSGKSSAAFAVMHALPQGATRSGAVRIEGADPGTLSPAALRRLRATRMSMVYQDPVRALSPALTIGTQLAEAYRLLGHGRRTAREEAAAILARVRIANPRAVLRRHPHELSGGMAQRVVIAMALAKQPALLVMDEPTTGLDADSAAAVMDIVETLRRETRTALLLISHDLTLVARHCSRIGILHAGTLAEQGETETILAAPTHPATRELLAARLTGRARPPPAALPAILAVAHLSRATPETPLLRDLSFTVGAGETLGLSGPSGSGKTTLTRILLGLQPADPGTTLRLEGAPLPQKLRDRAPAQRRAIQAVFQNPGAALNRALTIRRILTRAGAEQGAADLLRLVRLDPALLDRRPAELSGGQQQRIAIAHAIAGNPRVLICDEFTSALDPSVQKTVLDLMVELRETRRFATILISHDPAVMGYLADKVLELK